MEDTLKKLLNNEVFNEETRKAVAEAFKVALDEAKAEQEKSLRAEMAERFENEKKAIHAALEQFLEAELTDHIAEFRNGVEEVNKLKSEYADKIVAVKEQAQKYVRGRLAAVEKVVETVLKNEIKDLHESEKTNRRAYLKAIGEAKAQLQADREAFRDKGAAVLEEIINVKFAAQLDELREDIQAARKSEFGRELFETYYAMFRRQFFNSSKEFKGLTKKLEEAQTRLAKAQTSAKKRVAEAEDRAKKAELARKRVEESVTRQVRISKMLSGLSGKKREKMKVMLEAAKTQDLVKTYKRFLPEILNEDKVSAPARKKQRIEEAVIELKTGGQTTKKKELTEDNTFVEDDEILEIRRRAGVDSQ